MNSYNKIIAVFLGTAKQIEMTYMEEVEGLCSKIAIIDRGKIIVEGSKEELKVIVKQFGDAAYRVLQAVGDGVEIHAIHEGYLLDQFTIKNTNKRKDEYGGSLENRARFVTDIIKAIKKE